MKIDRSRKGKVIAEFDDIIEFAEYTDEVPEYNHSKGNSDNEWCGGTFEDAMTQAKTGNPELVEKLFDGVNVIEAMINEDAVGEIRDVTGEYFDVGDYLSGEPEVFRRDEYGNQKPVIPVYANFAMNGGQSTDMIMKRGCAIVALVDELEKSGFIVDLNLVHVVDYCKGKTYTKIKVRTNPLDLDTVAFIMANPLCLRRLWFAVLEQIADKPNCNEYGYPSEYDLPDLFSSGISGFYFVSSNHYMYSERYWKSLKSAKEHIMDMVDRFKKNPAQVILG